MLVFVKTLTGKTITLDVNTSDSVSEVKNYIHNKEGIPSNIQTLFFSNKILDNEQFLTNYNIMPEDVLQLTLRMA